MQRAQAHQAGRLLVSRLRVGAVASRVSHALTCGSFVSTRLAPSVCLASAVHTNYRFASSSTAAASGQRNHYRNLGIDTDATPQEVKAAYRQLALRYHPDVAAEEHRVQSEFLFRRVSEAYEVLSDPVRRRAHDSELGIQTRRKQTTTATTAAAASSSPHARGSAARASGSSASPFSATRRKRRAASQPSSSSAASDGAAQSGEARRYRKPFVRGDANRVFADAFDGKTLDEILFDVQRRRRQAVASAKAASVAGDASSPTPESSDASLAAGALDRDARLRHVMEEAAESFAHKAQRQYGHGILRHIRAAASSLPEGPSAPPQRYMPFRPFVGMDVPAGVQTPPEPQLGHVLGPQEATMDPTEDGSGAAGEAGRIPSQFHKHQYADGSLHSRMESLRKGTKHIEGMPHNMGQLYSYHRPY